MKLDSFSKGVSEFLNMSSQRAMIIFAFSMLETFISDLVKIKCKHPRSFESLSITVKISLLHELGEISDIQFESINWLRKQRNKAAHTVGFEVNQSEIQDRWVMEEIQGLGLLQKYLITTVGGFWNSHIELRDHYEWKTNA